MWNLFSTMMQLFYLFWSFYILRDIVNETNQYATTPTSKSILPGGGDTLDFRIVAEIKAWLATWLYMGMKWQPNMKKY
jgi:hypothetical protein